MASASRALFRVEELYEQPMVAALWPAALAAELVPCLGYAVHVTSQLAALLGVVLQERECRGRPQGSCLGLSHLRGWGFAAGPLQGGRFRQASEGFLPGGVQVGGRRAAEFRLACRMPQATAAFAAGVLASV
jgi:hypothetical protein